MNFFKQLLFSIAGDTLIGRHLEAGVKRLPRDSEDAPTIEARQN